MTKRPSLIGGLTLPAADPAPRPADLGPETPSSPQTPASSATPAPAVPAASGRRPRPDVVHTSLYLPREVHRRLREIAFTRDVKVHDVIMEGIDAALQRHGHPTAATLKGKDET